MDLTNDARVPLPSPPYPPHGGRSDAPPDFSSDRNGSGGTTSNNRVTDYGLYDFPQYCDTCSITGCNHYSIAGGDRSYDFSGT